MSAFFTCATSSLVTPSPCELLSVILTPTSAASGDITLYAARGAIAGHEILTIRTANSQTTQVRFSGLKVEGGLYIAIGSNVTRVTVEWEPVGYPRE